MCCKKDVTDVTAKNIKLLSERAYAHARGRRKPDAFTLINTAKTFLPSSSVREIHLVSTENNLVSKEMSQTSEKKSLVFEKMSQIFEKMSLIPEKKSLVFEKKRRMEKARNPQLPNSAHNED